MTAKYYQHYKRLGLSKLVDELAECKRIARENELAARLFKSLIDNAVLEERKACADIGERNMTLSAWEYSREIRNRSEP